MALLTLGFATVAVLQGCSSEQESPKREPLPLFSALDSAEFMVAYAVGLGDVKRERIIDGRRYRNFVQLLRTDRVRECLQDTFTTSCQTGLRLALYKDSTLVEEFRLADRIGYEEGSVGVWTPRHLAKINKFLKNNGAQFVACSDSAVVSHDLNVPGEKQRPVFVMPDFDTVRKKRKSRETAPETNGIPNVGGAPGVALNHTLQTLEELILPRDTALGEPLYVQSKNWNRGQVSFYKKVDGRDALDRTVDLTKEQLRKFGDLLKNVYYETYASYSNELSPVCELTLYKDSVAVMKLVNYWKEYAFMKFPMVNGKDLGPHGEWFPANSVEMRTFFEALE